MATPPPPSPDGRGADCRHGQRTPSKSSCAQQHLPDDNKPIIVVEGSRVRLVGGFPAKLDYPRRQGFAWPNLALEFATRLSRERGWPIEILSDEE